MRSFRVFEGSFGLFYFLMEFVKDISDCWENVNTLSDIFRGELFGCGKDVSECVRAAERCGGRHSCSMPPRRACCEGCLIRRRGLLFLAGYDIL